MAAPAPTSRFTKALLFITQAIGIDDVDAELRVFLFSTLREGCAEGGDGFADEVLASFLPLDALEGKKRASLVSTVAAAAIAGLARGAEPSAPAAPTAMEAALSALLERAGGGCGGPPLPPPPLPPPPDATFLPPPRLADAAASLSALLPQLSLEAACVALERCGGAGGGDAARAAAWLLEGGPRLEAEILAEAGATAERRAAAAAARAAAAEVEARAEGAARRATLRRFHEVANEAGKNHAPKVGFEAAPKKGVSVLRFVDGVPVYVRPGEKFLVEKPAEPPAGTLVALKMRKKGSGGASPNFK
jgi:hypothetical protein